ncbi:hypothetical protein Taro_021517, partial [Colocasia esculenta]|nr:hypothetical protein [Colocasia esculenta]
QMYSDFDALLREAILEENAMFLAVGEMLMSSIMDEDEEDTTPILRPMHTSRHTGHVWVHEVLQGHERRCYNTFRMHSSMFLKLRDILVERELIRDSRYVTTSEQLAMFLYAMRHGVAIGAMCEHFQHSSETISYYVNHVIKAIALLRFTYIVLPTGTDPIHPRIRHDDRFYPYFKDAIGAIDGTYIPAHVLKDKQARYRNKKNVIRQNVMGICGFDLIFHYVGVGFEGAAADMTVLRRAIDVGGFTVPQVTHILYGYVKGRIVDTGMYCCSMGRQELNGRLIRDIIFLCFVYHGRIVTLIVHSDSSYVG